MKIQQTLVDSINAQQLTYKAKVYPQFMKKSFMQLNMQSGKFRKVTYGNPERNPKEKFNKKPTKAEEDNYKKYNQIEDFNDWDKFIKPGR